MSKNKNGFAKFLLGAGIGAGLGVLFAPKVGAESRKELKIKLNELKDKLNEIDLDEVKFDIEGKIKDLKVTISELDKETVLKNAKEKAKEVQKKADELFDYAVKKGTPVLESAVDSIREKAVELTKEVLANLEKKEDK